MATSINNNRPQVKKMHKYFSINFFPEVEFSLESNVLFGNLTKCCYGDACITKSLQQADIFTVVLV